MKAIRLIPFVALTAATASQAAENPDTLQEVVVTAEKRADRILDVPVPVTALDANALAQSGDTRLQDYFTSVPGLNLTNSGDGRQTISIRGLTTGGSTNPTVGVVIDDVPYGSSTAQGLGGVTYPDIDPGDLTNIEVLRGPQGTLYGSSSIGGLLKFVTRDPSTKEFSGRVQVLGSGVDHGQIGYGVRGSVNIPVSDTVAIRASAFTRRDPGYVDNVTTGQRNVDHVDVHGGRLTALWRPNEDFSLKLSAMLQNIDGKGQTQVDTNSALQPTLGEFGQARMLGTGIYTQKIQFYTAAVSAKFGDIDFQALSGYGITRHRDYGDLTPGLGWLSDMTFGVAGSALDNKYPTDKFTQEFRLSSARGQFLEWRLGAFYTHEASRADQYLLAVEPSTGAPVGLAGEFYFPTQLDERALFADLTFNFTDRFNVQFGGRGSQIRHIFNETDSGPYVNLAFGVDPPLVYQTVRTKETPFTYLVTPQFKISPDLMAYARFASGYRSGGPNPAAGVFNLPPSYKPDKSNNYELGLKGEFFDRALTVDASVYYIQWKQIQLQLVDVASQFAYFANAGSAKSQGVELSIQAAPARGLKIAANLALSDAKLSDALPVGGTAVGQSGDRLPYSSRFSGSLSADQEFAAWSQWTGYVGASVSHVGSRLAEFTATEDGRFELPAYTAVDLRAGVRNDSWTVNLFVNNVGDKRGILAEGQINGPDYEVTYIQPRTVGLSITKTF